MNNVISRRYIILSSLSASLYTSADSLAEFKSYKCQEFTGKILSHKYREAPEFIVDIISKICEAAKIKNDFICYEIDYIGTSPAMAALINKQKYIFYTCDLLKEHLSNKAELSFVLAHEIGHHVLGDTYKLIPSNGQTQFLRESRADFFAGYMIRKLSFLIDEATKFFQTNKKSNSQTHPDWIERIASARKGYYHAKYSSNNIDYGYENIIYGNKSDPVIVEFFRNKDKWTDKSKIVLKNDALQKIRSGMFLEDTKDGKLIKIEQQETYRASRGFVFSGNGPEDEVWEALFKQ